MVVNDIEPKWFNPLRSARLCARADVAKNRAQ